MNRKAYLLLTATTLFWGGNAVAGKLAVGHISPMLLTSARWIVALAIIGAVGWRRLAEDWHLVRRHIVLLSLLGTFGFTLFNVFFYTALLYTSAINVSIEQAAMPMLIFLFSFLAFRSRVAPGQFAGLFLSITGIALTASHGEFTRLLELDVNVGDALMLVGLLVYAGYSVALRYRPAMHWQSLMIVLCASAFATSVPFAIAEAWLGTAIMPDAIGWAVLAYVVIFPSILSQAFYIQGVHLIGANRAGLFFNLVPIFGTLLSIVILGEDFHLYHAFALALVFGGIWLAERSVGR